MCGEAIVGMMFPGVMLGIVMCSMIFTVIVKKNERLRESLENGDESGRMLVYSFLAVEPKERRAADGRTVNRAVMRNTQRITMRAEKDANKSYPLAYRYEKHIS